MLGRGYVHHLHPVREEKHGNLFIKNYYPFINKGGCGGYLISHSSRQKMV